MALKSAKILVNAEFMRIFVFAVLLFFHQQLFNKQFSNTFVYLLGWAQKIENEEGLRTDNLSHYQRYLATPPRFYD